MALFRLIEVNHKKVNTVDFHLASKLVDYVKGKSGKPERLRLFEIEESKSKDTEFVSYADIVKYFSTNIIDEPAPPTEEVKPKKTKKKLLESKLQEQVQEAKQENADTDKVNFWDRFK